MIVKAKEAQNREFMGVPFVLLAVGEQSMVTKMHYRTGVRGAGEHSHINEQSGYVMSGKYRLRMEHFDGGRSHVHKNEASIEAKQWDDIILQAGDSYSCIRQLRMKFQASFPTIHILKYGSIGSPILIAGLRDAPASGGG